MLFLKNILLLGKCHMSVDFRYIDRTMTKHFLDISNINIRF